MTSFISLFITAMVLTAFHLIFSLCLLFVAVESFSSIKSALSNARHLQLSASANDKKNVAVILLAVNQICIYWTYICIANIIIVCLSYVNVRVAKERE